MNRLNLRNAIAQGIMKGQKEIMFNGQRYSGLPTGQGAGTGAQQETYARITADKLVKILPDYEIN